MANFAKVVLNVLQGNCRIGEGMFLGENVPWCKPMIRLSSSAKSKGCVLSQLICVQSCFSIPEVPMFC